MIQKEIPTFIVSLPKDRERREYLERQLTALGMPFSVFDAVHGKSLSPEELAANYDADKAVRLFNREMSRGEIGCALSHVGIYRQMVEQDIPHALILEDDASVLDRELPAILAKLAQFYPVQAPVAVLLNHVKRYDSNKKDPLDDTRCIYDAYRAVCTHAYFITKAGAEKLLRHLYPVYVVADKWEYFQERYIPVKALVPYPVGLAPSSVSSSIEAMGVREKKLVNSRNYMYYLRRYAGQLKYKIWSKPFVRVEFQPKLPSDFQEP